MIKKLAAATVLAVASVSVAHATDIPATPMSTSPAHINGMGPLGEIANIGLMPVNAGVQVVDATGVAIVGPKGAAAEPAPMMRKHRRHYMHRKMMSKKM